MALKTDVTWCFLSLKAPSALNSHTPGPKHLIETMTWQGIHLLVLRSSVHTTVKIRYWNRIVYKLENLFNSSLLPAPVLIPAP